MAGDVTVAVNGGNLVIEGNDEDSWVTVAPGASAGQYLVTQYEYDSEIRQLRQIESAQFEGVTGGLRANLRGGRDRLELINASFAGDVRISLGSGQDALWIEAPDSSPARIAGDLVISTGDGDDTVRIRSIAVEGDHMLNMGRGDDQAFYGRNENGLVGFTPFSIFHAGIDVAGRFWASLGDGQNSLDLFGSTSAASLTIHAAQGDDTLHLVNVAADRCLISTGAGNDWIEAEVVRANRFAAVLGAGEDTLALGEVAFSSTLIAGQNGNDALYDMSGVHNHGSGQYEENDLGLLVALGLEQTRNARPLRLIDVVVEPIARI